MGAFCSGGVVICRVARWRRAFIRPLQESSVECANGSPAGEAAAPYLCACPVSVVNYRRTGAIRGVGVICSEDRSTEDVQFEIELLEKLEQASTLLCVGGGGGVQ